MSDNVLELRPARPAVSVAGYVEAITETDVLGWAWQPGRPNRVAVELRLDGQLLCSTVADSPREDLARSGIGDGSHAFCLPIPPEWRARSHELQVLACLPDGNVTTLPTAPAPESGAAAGMTDLSRLQQGLDLLVSSQRLIHRNLQAALTQRTPQTSGPLAEISAAQSKLMESIDALECFVVRLEQALQGQSAPVPTARHPVAVQIALALSGLAFVGSLAALWRVLAGP